MLLKPPTNSNRRVLRQWKNYDEHNSSLVPDIVVWVTNLIPKTSPAEAQKTRQRSWKRGCCFTSTQVYIYISLLLNLLCTIQPRFTTTWFFRCKIEFSKNGKLNFNRCKHYFTKSAYLYSQTDFHFEILLFVSELLSFGFSFRHSGFGLWM